MYTHHYRPLVLALGDCIPVRPWSDSPIACLAELRMVWRDRNEQCLLIALRLYFLPENTPLGRNCHGELTAVQEEEEEEKEEGKENGVPHNGRVRARLVGT
uniref:Uncharacterized protein n=1 Tax=Anopheles epiroticus TaxID=199890 RepID=A0A182PBT4_9DIPT